MRPTRTANVDVRIQGQAGSIAIARRVDGAVPSTTAVFEDAIQERCGVSHELAARLHGGANMNAQVGLTSPAALGADGFHLNLHQTLPSTIGVWAWLGPIGVARRNWRPPPGIRCEVGGPHAIHAGRGPGDARIMLIYTAYIRPPARGETTGPSKPS